VILFDNVIQILALADLDAFILVGVVLFDGRRIGPAFIDIDQAGFAAGTNSFVQKAASSLLIPPGSQQKIYGVALLIDGTIQIFPLTLDVHVGLIKSPAISNSLAVFTKCLLNTRCVVHDPTLDGAVVYSVTALLHEFLQVAIAQ